MADGLHMAAGEPEPDWRPLRPGEKVLVLMDLVEAPDISREGIHLRDADAPEAMEQEPGEPIRIHDPFPESLPEQIPAQIPAQIERRISETSERIVRELAPAIIERVIREEIEKLKKENV